MAVEPTEPSYGALFRVAGFGRVAAATACARLGGEMWLIVIVLFVLQRYRSPGLAGLVVLLSILPGVVMAPIAGALLDRQGRIRLMILDYSMTATIASLIAILSLVHHLPVPLLLLLVTVLSIGNILSVTGARSLFPLMLPRTLWDRANGLDSSSYSLVAVVGPALAGVLVAGFGPETGLAATALAAGLAAIALIGLREPIAPSPSETSLVRDAWAGLTYMLGHRSLRGVAITFFISNLGVGVVPVGIPLLVLRRLHESAATVGQVFALFGLAGLIAGLVIGRMNTEGRERWLILGSTVGFTAVLGLLAVTSSLPMLFALAVAAGAVGAAGNIAIFAIRQRRTDPAWFGRAFAVSFSLNIAGEPIGSALSGPLLASSFTLAVLIGAGLNAVAAVAAAITIPKRAENQPV